MEMVAVVFVVVVFIVVLVLSIFAAFVVVFGAPGTTYLMQSKIHL